MSDSPMARYVVGGALRSHGCRDHPRRATDWGDGSLREGARIRVVSADFVANYGRMPSRRGPVGRSNTRPRDRLFPSPAGLVDGEPPHGGRLSFGVFPPEQRARTLRRAVIWGAMTGPPSYADRVDPQRRRVRPAREPRVCVGRPHWHGTDRSRWRGAVRGRAARRRTAAGTVRGARCPRRSAPTGCDQGPCSAGAEPEPCSVTVPVCAIDR